MKKSLIAAAVAAAITLGAAGTAANAGVAGVGLNGIAAHADKTAVEHVYYKKRYYGRHHYQHRKWTCGWRHGHRRCFWRTW
jgi:hypothetical protein